MPICERRRTVKKVFGRARLAARLACPWEVVLLLWAMGLLLWAGCGGRAEPTVSPLAPHSPLEPISPLPIPAGEGAAPIPRATLTPPGERPTPEPAVNAAALLRERCASCHTLDRVEQSRKTAEEWERTVNRMVGRGARLTGEEKQALIAYLAAQYGR